MGAILRGAPPERAPRRHVRRGSVPATMRHDVPSYDLALGQIWAKLVEKRQSYGIFSVFGSAAGGGRRAASGRQIGAKLQIRRHRKVSQPGAPAPPLIAQTDGPNDPVLELDVHLGCLFPATNHFFEFPSLTFTILKIEAEIGHFFKLQFWC